MMALSFILPLIFTIGQSISGTLSVFPSQLTLKWYTLKFEAVISSLGVTLLIAICASLLSLIYTLPVAYTLVKRKYPLRGMIDQAIILPILIPGIVYGLALMQFFKSVGLSRMPPYLILIIIHSVLVIPFIARPLIASLQQIDHALEEAAMTLGADEVRTFFDIIIPTIAPGILSGLLLAFARSSGDFIITLFFITPDFIPLSVRVFQSTSYGIPQITSAIAVTLMIVSIGYILISRTLFRVELQ